MSSQSLAAGRETAVDTVLQKKEDKVDASEVSDFRWKGNELFSPG
jgi:hypothetical protein